jgi:hypothetical protein
VTQTKQPPAKPGRFRARTLAAVTRFLNGNVRLGDGRTYAGGLTKFEPGEIQRLRIPDLAMLDAAAG